LSHITRSTSPSCSIINIVWVILKTWSRGNGRYTLVY